MHANPANYVINNLNLSRMPLLRNSHEVGDQNFNSQVGPINENPRNQNLRNQHLRNQNPRNQNPPNQNPRNPNPRNFNKNQNFKPKAKNYQSKHQKFTNNPLKTASDAITGQVVSGGGQNPPNVRNFQSSRYLQSLTYQNFRPDTPNFRQTLNFEQNLSFGQNPSFGQNLNFGNYQNYESTSNAQLHPKTEDTHESDDEEIPFNVDAIWKREFSSIFKSEFSPDLWGLEKCGDGNAGMSQDKRLNHLINPGYTNWLIFEESAKVRYCCNSCGNGWTSMKGKVVFYYHLFADWNDLAENGRTNRQKAPECSLYVQVPRVHGNPNDLVYVPRRIGLVKFQVFGQQCGSKSCKQRPQKFGWQQERRQKREDLSFELPIWYPEEISKVLQNLFNQVRNKIYKGPIGERRESLRTGRTKGGGVHDAKGCQACRDGSCKLNNSEKVVTIEKSEKMDKIKNSALDSGVSSGFGSSRKASTANY